MGIYGMRDGVFSPKKIKVLGKIPVEYTIQNCSAISTSAILSGFDLASHATNDITGTSMSAQPPYATRLRFTMGSSAAVSTNTLTVVGKNAKGETVTEAVSCPQTLGSTVDTNAAFARITTITSNATSDSDDISCGISTTVGLPYPIATTGDILSYTTDRTAATTYNKSGGLTIDTTYDTLVLPSLSAGSTASIVYLTQVQE